MSGGRADSLSRRSGHDGLRQGKRMIAGGKHRQAPMNGGAADSSQIEGALQGKMPRVMRTA